MFKAIKFHYSLKVHKAPLFATHREQTERYSAQYNISMNATTSDKRRKKTPIKVGIEEESEREIEC